MSEELYKKLEDEFYRSNHPKYRKYFLVSVFHNVELLLEPSFGQLEVKETALS